MSVPEKPSFNTPLDRRRFLGQTAALAAGAPLLALTGCGGTDTPAPPALSPATVPAKIMPSGWGRTEWSETLNKILSGFIRNAVQTSDTFAVCDYAGGTMLDNFVTARGRTCDSVTRILPAIAAVIAGPDSNKTVEVEGAAHDLREVFLSAIRHATDPDGKDFWGYASPKDWDQRQVESSIVAFSLWLSREQMMDEFGPETRRNIQRWLESCTQVDVRRNNWALFTAVNHAVRIALGERWGEFRGDEGWFRGDLAAIDSMYAGGGWYTDTTQGDQFDYYNFWVFASHNLYWDMVAGERFPDLRARFRSRLNEFLRSTPWLFGGDGSHVMWGRSLIYRWATLTPLVLAHGLGIWPLSTGLLRRICNRNLKYLWELGAWDEENGKLRESMTPHSSPAIKESYINNGHPYWGMQAFFAASLPKEDAFWTADEEPLPVEQGDFTHRIEGPGLLIAGCKQSGQVQVWQSACDKPESYRSKYYNFSYSSHFPYNVELTDNLMAPDCTLSFSDDSGGYARRDTPFRGNILGVDSLEWEWSAELNGVKIAVKSLAVISGEIQWRAHKVKFSGEWEIEVAEHTYALGLTADEAVETSGGDGWEFGRSPNSGAAVFIRGVYGFDSQEPISGFRGRENLSSTSARAVQAAVSGRLSAGGEHVLIAAVYGSPAPLETVDLLNMTGQIPAEVAAWSGIRL